MRYLVKGGEDLRLDQRVQLLFKRMNSMLAASTACVARRLALKTYEVVPLNGETGLIEWMNGTETVRQMIEKRAPKGALDLEAATVRYTKQEATKLPFREPTDYIRSFKIAEPGAIEANLANAQVLARLTLAFLTFALLRSLSRSTRLSRVVGLLLDLTLSCQFIFQSANPIISQSAPHLTVSISSS